jgi:hypothetical protein
MTEPDRIMEILEEYCEKYDVPLEHLAKIISDLKVIPMIRGKGFEFTISDELKKILPQEKWGVSNPRINAQPTISDIDVKVTRLSDDKKINIECKLTKKASFKIEEDFTGFQVKCMRSRTVNDNVMATNLSGRYGISRDLLLLHRDNYRENDFDFVITSLGNSFWVTENNDYIFKGNEDQHEKLSEMFPRHFVAFDNFQNEAFDFFLFARSSDIKVDTSNNITCVRRKCITQGFSNSCGFIPDYPIVNLKEVVEGKSPWKLLSCIEEEFEKFL